MAEYIENMFSIPIFHLYADDWENKKQKLIDIASRQQFETQPGEYCSSDYFNQKKTYLDELKPLINDEIQRLRHHDLTQFRQGCRNFKVTKADGV